MKTIGGSGGLDVVEQVDFKDENVIRWEEIEKNFAVFIFFDLCRRQKRNYISLRSCFPSKYFMFEFSQTPKAKLYFAHNLVPFSSLEEYMSDLLRKNCPISTESQYISPSV